MCSVLFLKLLCICSYAIIISCVLYNYFSFVSLSSFITTIAIVESLIYMYVKMSVEINNIVYITRTTSKFKILWIIGNKAQRQDSIEFTQTVVEPSRLWKNNDTNRILILLHNNYSINIINYSECNVVILVHMHSIHTTKSV